MDSNQHVRMESLPQHQNVALIQVCVCVCVCVRAWLTAIMHCPKDAAYESNSNFIVSLCLEMIGVSQL
jgi:hypothetical protein